MAYPSKTAASGFPVSKAENFNVLSTGRTVKIVETLPVETFLADTITDIGSVYNESRISGKRKGAELVFISSTDGTQSVWTALGSLDGSEWSVVSSLAATITTTLVTPSSS